MTTAGEIPTQTESVGSTVGAVSRLPQLILVFRCDQPTAPGMLTSLAGIEEVVIGRGETATLHPERQASLLWTLPDSLMSRRHARIRRERSGWVLADLGSKNGTFLGGRGAKEEHLRDGDLIRVGSAIFTFRFAPMRLDVAEQCISFDSISNVTALDTLATEIAEHWHEAAVLARTNLPLLVLGETGSGKEQVSRELHRRSGRAGDFVAVNCGALPANLVESELFGHRKGAFSGADADKVGLVERADHGTLFLDEIAELSPSSQVALLRVLQEGTIRAVGATDQKRVNVRFIAATHRDLPTEVAAGRFREDLLGRLDGHQVRVPPLRERRVDMGLLIARMLSTTLSHLAGARFSPGAFGTLLGYEFPRNVRELEHAIHRAHAIADDLIRTKHLPEAMQAPVVKDAADDPDLETRLTQTLSEVRGNVSEAARRFGKAPVQIRRWCQRFGIDISEFRDK